MKGTVLILGWVFVLGACATHGDAPPEAGSATPQQTVTVGGVDLDVRCTPVPDDAEKFYATLRTTNNGTRVASGDPDFPSDFCPAEALFATVGNDGPEGDGTIGKFTWRGPAKTPSIWCAMPGMVIWSKHEVVAKDGTLTLLEETQVFPPAPAKFEGTFTVLGGTGRYEGAEGVATLVGRQTGDGIHSGHVMCGWLRTR